MSPVRPERTSVSVQDARDIILDSILPLGTESVGLRDAVGRVLAQPVTADRQIPPLANSGMDGFALRAEDAANPPAELRVVAEVAAGHLPDRKIGPGEAARILTGAAIPEGADAVVMQEQTERDGKRVRVLAAVETGQNIRPAGGDVRPGQEIAEAGLRIRPAMVGMLAALGRTQVEVTARPRVAVLATGDELVEPEDLVDDGRIVTSNSYGLQASLDEIGAEPVYLGIARDDPDAIRGAFREGLSCDAVISTGGVSVGDRDWIKQVLADLGGEMRLWRIRLKPGAPLAFVMLEGKPVFGLPGNPVSTLVTFEQFVRPALLRMMGHQKLFRPSVWARLVEGYRKPAGRAHLLRVCLELRDGEWLALPTGNQSSQVLLSMVHCDGLAFIPEDAAELAPGSAVPVQLLRRTDLVEEPVP